MPTIDLQTAATHIKLGSQGDSQRFFFLVGAGISSPEIPLSREIIAHCKREAKRNYPNGPGPSKPDSLSTYSYWLEHAYPHRMQRRDYLHSLIAGKHISHANLRLAHLVSSERASSLVVTPNFDDHLERALALFGGPPVTCDHPATVERIELARKVPQIVHVHGTYWFYDCCNLTGEIEDRALSSAKTSMTMAGWLDALLFQRAPIIVGYSGWEGDIVMRALRRRLAGPLPINLYWFCYQEADFKQLPDWLTVHSNAYFVLPRPVEVFATPPYAASVDELQDEAAVKKDDEQPVPESCLEASEIFTVLIQTLDLRAPDLTQDPLGFFATTLRACLPSRGSDIYFFESVVARIERAKTFDQRASMVEAQLERVRDAIRRLQYTEAAERASAISTHSCSRDQREELFELHWMITTGLTGASKISCYDRVIALGDVVVRESEDRDSIEERVASALLNKGITLGQLNRSEDEIAVYDEVVRRFGEAAEPAVREQVARALFNKGVTFGQLNRSEEAIAVYDEVLRRFGEAVESALRESVARALVNKGFRLGQLNRSDEEIAVYDEVVRRFGEAVEPALREEVARALFNKGITLGQLNRSEEEIAVYDEVVRRFGQAVEPRLREAVARALVNKGITLGQLNRSEEAIAVYDEVVRRFGEAVEPALREHVRKALVEKYKVLLALKREQEARELYDQIIAQFGEDAFGAAS